MLRVNPALGGGMLAGVGRNSAGVEPFMRFNNYGQDDTARGRYDTYRSACLQCRKVASKSLGSQFVGPKSILSTARPQNLRVKRWEVWPLMSVAMDDVRVIIANAGPGVRATRFGSPTSRLNTFAPLVQNI